MMRTTEKVARGLHQRFDELIDILKETASSQRKTTSEMISILKSIDSKLGGNSNRADNTQALP